MGKGKEGDGILRVEFAMCRRSRTCVVPHLEREVTLHYVL